MRPAALLAVLLVAISVHALDVPRPNESWITLRVDEFTFVSNVSPAATTEIARDLLRMREAVGRVTNLKVRSSKPTRIFIFASERAFAPYREAILQQKQENVRGAFISAESGNFIVMKRDGAVDVERTVYHELTHYFVRNTLAGLPLWASEGIAEYYSTFGTSGDSVSIGRPIAEHVRWLREGTLISVRDLLATTVDSPIYNERSLQGVFYAQSWALFHYLMVDEARRAQFGHFLALLGKGKSVDDSFSAAFRKSYADLEGELRSYVRRQSFTFERYSLSELRVPEVPAPEAMSRDALLYELGHLLAHVAPHTAADAERFLDEALAANPTHSAAYADLGRLHHLAGRTRDAEAAFARAVQLGSGDPLVHLVLGISALERFERPGELLKARKAFERSAELDPTSARAWTGIGATYVVSEDDPAPGIAALEKSLALAPGEVDAAFNLVQLYTRAGRRADAQRLIDTVLVRGAKQETLDFVRELLLLDDMETLGREGKTEEALALARTIAARTKDASLKAHLETVIADLDAATTANRTIQAINDAIAKANAGKVEEALAIMDGVLPQIQDAEMLSKAKELRAELASQKRKNR